MAVTYGALECRQSTSQRASPGTVVRFPSSSYVGRLFLSMFLRRVGGWAAGAFRRSYWPR